MKEEIIGIKAVFGFDGETSKANIKYKVKRQFNSSKGRFRIGFGVMEDHTGRHLFAVTTPYEELHLCADEIALQWLQVVLEDGGYRSDYTYYSTGHLAGKSGIFLEEPAKVSDWTVIPNKAEMQQLLDLLKKETTKQ